LLLTCKSTIFRPLSKILFQELSFKWDAGKATRKLSILVFTHPILIMEYTYS
jgi:hypothetical protein